MVKSTLLPYALARRKFRGYPRRSYHVASRRAEGRREQTKFILPNSSLAGVTAWAVYSHVVLKRELEVISSHARARSPVHADLLVVLWAMSWHATSNQASDESNKIFRGNEGSMGKISVRRKWRDRSHHQRPVEGIANEGQKNKHPTWLFLLA